MLDDTLPLPSGWSPLDVCEDVIVADGLELRRAGLSSTSPTGEEITGAAVERTESPIRRGYFELLERVSTVEAISAPQASYRVFSRVGRPLGERTAAEVFPATDDPTQWRYSRSNGVSLHQDWHSAAERALCELAERDHVLRSWLGQTTPVALQDAALDVGLGTTSQYEWLAFGFPAALGTSFSTAVEVVGVFGFPGSDRLPVAYGYAGRKNQEDALAAAAREALQILGFLWGEIPASVLPSPTPTAQHHLEHYQWPAHRNLLRRWLEGGHRSFGDPTDPASDGSRRASAPFDEDSAVVFADLTPMWLTGGLRVAKALCREAVPLAFGNSPFASNMRGPLRFHPIA
jgi:hypothetical protein